ncbi:MAG TPA: lamin tail domain-containing protein [Acidobacteriota bacterium]|nr:lamin tail domain-containing protein [Acidobacteriota bacterium]
MILKNTNTYLPGVRLLSLAFLFLVLTALFGASAMGQVVINEIDYDQSGTDAAEYFELYNAGASSVSLADFEVQLINGNGGSVYNTISLPAVSLPAGGFFVVCANAATVDNCDLDSSPDTNFIQNGSPDAIALFENGMLVDAVSYEGDVTGFVEGSGAGLEDDPNIDLSGISRFPNGTDTDSNNVDLSPRCATPGFANVADTSNCASVGSPAVVVINEIDYDQPGTDAAEFIEIKNDGGSSVDLSGYELRLVNGNGGSVYNTIALPSISLAAGEYFVVCANAATVANCDLDSSPDTNFIQNGAPDAVALFLGAMLVDTVSYEGDVPGFVEGSGSGLEDDPGFDQLGISRFPDGADTDVNNVDFSQRCATPGGENTSQSTACDQPPAALEVVINEIDYDQPGTDTAEFIELKNNGASPANLGTLSLQLINGNGGSAYETINLPSVDLTPGGYFVVCADAASTDNCDLDVSPDSNLIQNGSPDAVALFDGGNLIDAVSYEGNVTGFVEGSGTGLEDDPGVALAGISRFPDGTDTDSNNVDFSLRCITPGGGNVEQSSDCANLALPELVINEIDYDQPSTDSEEFVEIKNVGNAAADLSSFTLQFVNGNGASVYRTIPLPALSLPAGGYFVVCANAATVPNCDLDSDPDTNFIQNGPDAVALLQGGSIVDTVSYEGDVPGFTEGSGTGAFDSGAVGDLGLSRIPDGNDTDNNDADFQATCLTPGSANLDALGCLPDAGMREIYEIQGAGNASPFDGQAVTTNANVVTALASNGFFMQTPAARRDGDAATSDGIFVFTSSAPTVSVGDLVDVRAAVDEFFDLTELTSPMITLVGSSALPAPVVLDLNTPSAMPMAIPSLEPLEGMLVSVDGVTTGPTDQFGDAPVTVQGQPRPFREPGIEFPGLMGLPVWDGNPEVFEINPDGAGLADQSFNTGATFSASGALTFSFGDYQVFPTQLTLGSPGITLPQPVGDRAAAEFALGSLNMLRLFGGQGDTQDRLDKFSIYIRDVLKAPEVLAVQEVDTLQTLQALAAQINTDDATISYTAFLEEGNDPGGIDVGFLVRDSIQVNSVTQVGLNEINPFDGSLLNDRPPLILDAVYTGGVEPFPFTAIVVHQRSLNGIDDPADGDRVRNKRFNQAAFLAETIDDLQTLDPDVRLVVMGDFNAFEFTDGYVHVLSISSGVLDPLHPDEALLPAVDLIDPDMTNQIPNVPAQERYTFIFAGSGQVLDHALTSTGMNPFVSRLEIPRANADAADVFMDDPTSALRSSDHEGIVLFVDSTPQAQACSYLGNSPGFSADKDSFLFEGEAGRQVTLELTASGDNDDGEATLILFDRIQGIGKPLFLSQRSDLPQSLSAVLPADGFYEVIVQEQPRAGGYSFQGEYCLRLIGEGSLAPGPWTEED